MTLVKSVLQNTLYIGLKSIMTKQAAKATSGDEQENPDDVCNQIANDMATVISDAVDAYIKSGDIYVSGSNITVVSPHGGCTVSSASPAKVQ